MNRESQQYKDAFYRFRKSMQRKTLQSAMKDEDIRYKLVRFKHFNIVFVYTYKAGRLFMETSENNRTLFIVPTAESEWSTDDFLVAEEGLFEDYYAQHPESRKQ